MKVILPLAGLGTRMRPHTWSKPKPLINVAGKPVLGHVLDMLVPLDVDEVIFIVGWLGGQVQEYVEANYSFKTRYVVQEELKGQAHAIYLAKEYISGPSLIIFVDTIFEANLDDLAGRGMDALLFTQEVEDPRRFGVAVQENGRVVRLIEKPSGFEHRDAVVGVYYIREGTELIAAIDHLLAHDLRTRGEFYLADAFQVMIDRGARIACEPVGAWEDCGQPDAVLHTQRYLMDRGHTQEIPVSGSVLIPPVHVAATAQIENAVVGPYVTVGEGAIIRDAVVRDSIIEAGATVQGICVERTLVGRRAQIKAAPRVLNVGDDDALEL